MDTASMRSDLRLCPLTGEDSWKRILGISRTALHVLIHVANPVLLVLTCVGFFNGLLGVLAVGSSAGPTFALVVTGE